MMKTIDILMVLLFPFLDSIPFTLPRYWMFRDKLRVPFRYIVLLQIILSSVYSTIFYYINLEGYIEAAKWTTILRYCFMIIFLAFAFLLIKDRFSKLMFTWLLFLAWQFFVLGNANFIETRFYLNFSKQHPYMVYNIARVIIYLITYPFLHRFFNHTVSDALKMEDKAMWQHFWKIPLFSTLFGMLYCTVTDVYAFASWQFLISRYLMLLGACYVSYVALKVMEISRSRTRLEEALKYADRNLLAQKKQFDTLSAHMEAMHKARHDLRQHLTVVQAYLDKEDKTGLSEYIDMYKNQLPPDIWEYFCANDVVNAVISYYAAQARENGIEFLTKVSYPKDSFISSTDITVLLGNLLENAVEGCKHSPDIRKFIKLRIKLRGMNTIMILIDNPCRTDITFVDGIPMSSKREGMGVGCGSICEIAARYGGTALFEIQNNIFCASVVMTRPDNLPND